MSTSSTRPILEWIPLTFENLHEGNHYIRHGKSITPCPRFTNVRNIPANQEILTVFRKQPGRLLMDYNTIFSAATRSAVRCHEADAMKLVHKWTSVPVPTVSFHLESLDSGTIRMSSIDGRSWADVWSQLKNPGKENVCRQIWAIIDELREIQRSPELEQ